MDSVFHLRGNTKCFGQNGVEQIGHVMFLFLGGYRNENYPL